MVGAIEEPQLEIYQVAESVHHYNQIIPEKSTKCKQLIMSTSMCVFVCVLMYMWVHLLACMCLCVYVCVHVYVCVCVHVCACMPAYVYEHACIC